MNSFVAGLVVSIVLPLIPGGTAHYQAPERQYETIYAQVTAYTSDPHETDEEPLVTASGEQVSHGTLACPSRLPFGTKVEIEGRVYTCNDRMNKRYRDTEHYDIWVADKELAYEWGRKDLQIKVYLD